MLFGKVNNKGLGVLDVTCSKGQSWPNETLFLIEVWLYKKAGDIGW